jgi:hypothetical protein
MTILIKNSVTYIAKILKVYTVLALVGAGVVLVAQLSVSLGHMPNGRTMNPSGTATINITSEISHDCRAFL